MRKEQVVVSERRNDEWRVVVWKAKISKPVGGAEPRL